MEIKPAQSAFTKATRVSTLVFIDLETTGLPFEIGTENVHITEISMVAIARDDFGGPHDNFRVVNKLSLCIQPRAAISLGAMDVTGLHNGLLESQMPFDASTALLLCEFLQRLQHPVCLLAHNGNRYDFPLLQAELARIRRNLPSCLLCADTLQAFRSIGLSSDSYVNTSVPENFSSCINQKEPVQCTSKPSSEINRKQTDTKHGLSENDLEHMLADDIEIFSNLQPLMDSHTESANFGNSFVGKHNEASNACQEQQFHSVPEVLFQGWMPAGSGETTPSRKSNSTQGPPKNNKHHNKQGTFIQDENSGPKARRKLQVEGNRFSPVPNKQKPKVQYSLEKLYLHFFGEIPPSGHHAENDCIALMKVCHKARDKFLNWIDKYNLPFMDIAPMW